MPKQSIENYNISAGKPRKQSFVTISEETTSYQTKEMLYKVYFIIIKILYSLNAMFRD